MLKIQWCIAKKWKTGYGGHYFNKKNICTRCNKKYEELITDIPDTDGKVLSK